MNNTACIILAAGKGERMKSQLPKVLHPVAGRPMVEYVLDLARDVGCKRTVVVLGYKHQEVKRTLPGNVVTVLQKRISGTADAVGEALPALRGSNGNVLILYADIPLLKKETIAKLLKYHCQSGAAATILAANVEKPQGYGRILRDKYYGICGIVEEKDADDFQKDIKEINTGIICFTKSALAKNLHLIKPNNKKKEYYLTDIIGILSNRGSLVESQKMADADEAMGINDRGELAKANKIMYSRINEQWMKKGVAIYHPETTFINYGVSIGRDSVIYPFTVIENSVKIGKRCVIGPFVHLGESEVVPADKAVRNEKSFKANRV